MKNRQTIATATLTATIIATCLLFVLACGETAPSASNAPSLEVSIPMPELSAADPAVREQVEAQRAKIEALLDSASGATAKQVADAFGELGQVYIVYDFLDAAAGCFGQAKERQPEDFRWSYLLGYVALIQGQLDTATPLLERALELEPKFEPASLRLARARLDGGAPDEAERLFRRSLEARPTAAAWEGLARIAEARGQDSEAIEHFGKALELQPEATGLRYALGQAYRRLGDVEQAQRQLEQRGDVGVRIEDPLLNPLANLGESVQFSLVQAAEAMEDGNYEIASGAYQQALEQAPTELQAYRGLSFSQEKLGDIEGAMATLETALETAHFRASEAGETERAEIFGILGGLALLQRDDDRAISWFEQSLALDAEQVGTRMKLGNALARGQRFAPAIEQYDAILESEPEGAASVLVARATAKVNLDQKEAALADFKRALELEPESSAIMTRYAAALEHFGDASAVSALRNQSPAGGENVTRVAESARVALQSGDVAGAARGFRQALALDGERTDLRYQLASALGHLGQLPEAVTEYRQVIEKEPRHAAARRGEITALLLSHRWGEARLSLQAALKEFSLDAQLAVTQARLLAIAPDESVRDGRLAVEISRRLVEARPQDPLVLETLAMAHAAAGDSKRAAEIQQELIRSAENAGAPEPMLATLRLELEIYQLGEAWRASSPHEILAGLR